MKIRQVMEILFRFFNTVKSCWGCDDTHHSTLLDENNPHVCEDHFLNPQSLDTYYRLSSNSIPNLPMLSMFQIFFEDAIREYTTVKRLTRLLDRIYLNKKIELGRLKLKIRRLKAVEERIDPVMDLVDYDCGENKFENVEREFKDVEELCQIIRNASEKSKERRRELEEIISSINKRSI